MYNVYTRSQYLSSSYPLTIGKSWTHKTNFILTIEETKYLGKIIEENYVKSFEDIIAEDGKILLRQNRV